MAILVFIGRKAISNALALLCKRRTSVARGCFAVNIHMHSTNGMVTYTASTWSKAGLGSSPSLAKNFRTVQDRLFSSLLKFC